MKELSICWIMRALLTFFLIVCHFGFAAEIGTKKPNPSDIRIVPVSPTPEPDNVKVITVFPQNGQILWSNPVRTQFRLLGFPVGTNSDFERAKEIYNDPNGQSLLVFIDDLHPIEIYDSYIDALDQNNPYFDWLLSKTIPFYLKEGMHVIRAFPDRSYGESLKGPGCFSATTFYIGSNKTNLLNIDLSAPYLTYNEPLETLRYRSDKPILLDFYLSNVQLSSDGYKVQVTINGNVIRSLTNWVPYYIYGLTRGTHTVQLQLLNEQNKLVPGVFNDVTRTITVD